LNEAITLGCIKPLNNAFFFHPKTSFEKLFALLYFNPYGQAESSPQLRWAAAKSLILRTDHKMYKRSYKISRIW
jgi:hypothetical protein